jgi:transketolase
MGISENIDYKETRIGFGDALSELGKRNDRIVALCADLTDSLSMRKFSNLFHNRFFQIGIAEANMMCIAAGLAVGGYIPFTGTFANFSTSRVYDQIRQSIAYSNKNVKICASHAGLTLGEDGATHQSLEDIGLMKMLPNMVVINTCDYNQTYLATLAIASYVGPVYLRFGRPSVPNFTDINPNSFIIGQANKILNGSDVSVIATGHMVWEAYKACKILAEDYNIHCDLINIHTIKPIDVESIINSISKTKCVVTAEEHNYYGGLGESVARLLTTHNPVPQEFVAVQDVFGESGNWKELMEKYDINDHEIVKKAIQVIRRKGL